MPNKRRNRGKTPYFPCPFCEQRLWRLGGEKHFVYYETAKEISINRGLTHKKSVLVANQGVYVDKQSWLEEFLCGEHGRLWLLVQLTDDREMKVKVAEDHDWKRTVGTINPNIPNASVGEFTYRMSRQSDVQLRGYYNF